MSHLIPIVAILSTFSCVAFVFYIIFRSRHAERMALIEHGLDASIFRPYKTKTYNRFLKWGLILAFIGAGLLIGVLLDVSFNNDGPLFTFSALFLFGGIGLMAYYFIMKKTEDEEELKGLSINETEEVI